MEFEKNYKVFMKYIIKIIDKIIKSETIFSILLKVFIKKIDNNIPLKYSYLFNTSERPHYTYCCYNAAKLAKSLGIKEISVIELGVAGGNGIICLEKISKKIEKELKIKIRVFGFDSGEGMYEPNNKYDLPYFFKEGTFKINVRKLNEKINNADIIYGDVKDTILKYVSSNKIPPIGAILNDLDYYTSTLNSLDIYNYYDYFLPRVISYFDDTVGSEEEYYNNQVGQLRAINEFNKNAKNKITLNQNLLAKSKEIWRYQIYYTHFFENENYNTNVISKEYEDKLNDGLKLKY